MRTRPIISVTINPTLLAVIDAEAARLGIKRARVMEALLASGVSQIQSGEYAIVPGTEPTIERRA